MNKITTHKESIFKKFFLFLSLTVLIAVMAVPTVFSAETPVLDLRSTENFVVLAGSSITGIPPVSIEGDVGLSPAAGSNITGFDGSNVDGTLYVVDASGPAGSVIAPSLLSTAKSDLTTAYNDAAGRTPVPTGPFLNPGSGNIGGMNLVPGLYKFTSTCEISGSDLTLTGDETDVWIFQIGTSLDVASGIKIILAGGAQAGNVFFQVGSSATLGTYCDFKGTILADQSISMGTGASFDGRALAFTGAVTIASDLSINIGLLEPEFSADSSQVRFGNVVTGSTNKDTINVTNTGGADLAIDSVISSNNSFTVSPANDSINPGSTKQFYITYSPVSDGSDNGDLYFYHNAANSIDTIQVSGNSASLDISTLDITVLGNEQASSGGKNINDNGIPITAKGVVWNTTGSPTLSDNSTNDGSGDADFTSLMDNLDVNETYYVRAYATNSYGTAYGNEKTFVYTAIPTLPEWGLIVLGSLVAIFAVRKIIV